MWRQISCTGRQWRCSWGSRPRARVVTIGLLAGALLVVVPGVALGSAASSGLQRIVASDGSHAVASPIVNARGGDIALVMHTPAVKVVADVYRYRGGQWRQVARVPLFDGQPTDVPGWTPRAVRLTGATDFLVQISPGANGALSTVLSDVGGDWHRVPFRAPAGAKVQPFDGFVGSALEPVAHGREITTQTDTCVPDCASGALARVTWRYDAAARALEPASNTPAGAGLLHRDLGLALTQMRRLDELLAGMRHLVRQRCLAYLGSSQAIAGGSSCCPKSHRARVRGGNRRRLTVETFCLADLGLRRGRNDASHVTRLLEQGLGRLAGRPTSANVHLMQSAIVAALDGLLTGQNRLYPDLDAVTLWVGPTAQAFESERAQLPGILRTLVGLRGDIAYIH